MQNQCGNSVDKINEKRNRQFKDSFLGGFHGYYDEFNEESAGNFLNANSCHV